MIRICQKAKTILGICLILSAGGHAAFLAAAHLQTEVEPELTPLPWEQARSVQLDTVTLPELWQQPEPEVAAAVAEPVVAEPREGVPTDAEQVAAAVPAAAAEAPPEADPQIARAPAVATPSRTAAATSGPTPPSVREAPEATEAPEPLEAPSAPAVASAIATSADVADMAPGDAIASAPSPAPGADTTGARAAAAEQVTPAGGSGETVLRGAAAARYLARVRSVLGAPPAPEGAHGEEGTVELLVVLDDRGRVLEVRVITSSGHQILDDSALAWLQNRRLPRPPRELRDDRVAFAVPIQYVAG